MCKRLLLFILLCSMALGLQATIGITASTDPTGETACNGTITVTADGSAGPFTLRISGPNGFSDQVDGIRGEHTFRNLCGGSYAVGVESALMCEKTFQKTLKGSQCDEDPLLYPYIQKLELCLKIGNAYSEIYEANWQDDGSKCLVFSPNQISLSESLFNKIKDGSADLLIRAYSSRVLTGLSLELPGKYSGAMQFSNASWELLLSNNSIIQSLVDNNKINQVFIFSGQAADGKSILDLKAMSDDLNSCAPIPVLLSDCSWKPAPLEGNDDVHILRYGCMNQPLVLGSPRITDICGNSGKGAVNITLTNGAAPYTYQWTGPNGFTSNVEDLTNLTVAGDYCVTIKDICNSTIQQCYNLRKFSVGAAQIRSVEIFPTCTTEDNSSKIKLDIFFADPYSDYQMTWSNGMTRIVNPYQEFNSGSGNVEFFGFSQGNHTLTIKLGSCLQTYTYQVQSAESGLQVEGTIQYGCGASIDLSVRDTDPYTHYGPFKYLWSNGHTTEDVQGLLAGTHCVTVTTASGCKIEKCFTINQQQTMAKINAIVANGCNGSIYTTVDPAQTTFPYKYLWNTGATTKDLTGLDAATYCVTVTIADGCNITKCFKVENQYPSPQIILENIKYASSAQASDGFINVKVTSGFTPLRYSWSNGKNTEDINGLRVGEYILKVSDRRGCTSETRFFVNHCYEVDQDLENEFPPIELEFFTQNISEPGGNDGALSVSASGGNGGPYYFIWRPGSSLNDVIAYEEGRTSSMKNLSYGIYELYVTDGCNSAVGKRLITNCEDHLFEISKTEVGKPCPFIGQPIPGGITAQVKYAFEKVDFFWETQSGGVWYLVFREEVSTVNGNATSTFIVRTPGFYRLIAKDLTWCERRFSTYIEGGVGGSFNWPDKYGPCFKQITCNGGVVFEDEEFPEVQLNPNDKITPCSGVLMCQGEYGPLIVGEERSSGRVQSSVYPGYGIQNVTCDFNLGGKVISKPAQKLVLLSGTNGDLDHDGIPDASDPCPSEPVDPIGDFDEDAIDDACDNCLNKRNPDQIDSDADGLGDACEFCKYVSYLDDVNKKKAGELKDSDGDGFGDNCDNCPDFFNPEQCDIDKDGIGDHCDKNSGSKCEKYDIFTGCCKGPQALQSAESGNEFLVESMSVIDLLAHPLQKITINGFFPNPFQDYINLSLLNEGKAGMLSFSLVDFWGKRISLETRTVTSGQNYYRLDYGKALFDGVYYLLIADEQGNILSQKMLRISK